MQKNMPLGYIMKSGKIQIEPNAAHVVSMCFEMYASGKSLYTISMELISMNIHNRKDEVKWTHSSISNILSNVKYKGFDEYEAIVSEELFDKVQEMRMRNALKSYLNNAVFESSGYTPSGIFTYISALFLCLTT